MKCTICGHSTMPGAMLCRPCRAALKRARYMSVQMDSPSSMMQGRPRRLRTKVAALAAPLASPSAAKVLAAHAAAVAPAVPPARTRPLLRSLAIGAAAVAALGVVAWLGQAPERDAGPMAQPAVPARVTAVNVDAAPVTSVAPVAKASADAATSVLVTSSPADEAPQPASRARVPRAPAPAPARPQGAAMLSSAPGAESYEMVPEPPRPAPAAPVAVPAPPPPPPPDRWQTMRDSLARCDREGGLGGFICDQRVRLDSCEGYWGKVPQCPLPPENPH